MLGGKLGALGGPTDVGSPDFVAGISVGLSLASKLAIGMGASLTDACGECAVCRALSGSDRAAIEAGLTTGRVLCGELSEEIEGLAEYVMTFAVTLGYVPPKDDGPGV